MTHHLEVLVSRLNGERRKYRFALRGDDTYCWVECGRVAPPEGAIFPALVYAGLVQAVADGGRIMLETPSRWVDQSIGVWGRHGTSGAYWGHAWRVDSDGYRIGHWVASWHSSMAGKVNEDIQGDPYVLATCWALQAWADLVSDGGTVTVTDEAPTLVIRHPDAVSAPADQLPEARPSEDALISVPCGAPEPPPPPPPTD